MHMPRLLELKSGDKRIERPCLRFTESDEHREEDSEQADISNLRAKDLLPRDQSIFRVTGAT